jgi:hypothetical protein
MKTKLLGIILSILGISGLIVSFVYMNEGGGSSGRVNVLFACGICSTLIFFGGVRLVPTVTTYRKTVKVISDGTAE